MDELLEREGELARIGDLLGRACAGEGELALVEGPPGIGKTALLGAARERAATAGLAVLQARGAELEREFPFGVARQLFEPLLRQASPRTRSRLLSGAAAPAAPLVWDAPSVADGEAEPRTADPSFGAIHGLYRLIAGLATRGPLLLCVDDAHWCDSGSLRFLAYLARRLPGLAVLVLVAARAAGHAGVLPQLDALTEDPRRPVMRPSALSEQATAVLVATLLGAGEASFTHACHEVTAGNPFLLRELCVHFAQDGGAPDARAAERVHALGPSSVARSALARVGRLSAGAPALARGTAILGSGVALAEAAALAELAEDEAERVADELAGAHVLEAAWPLRFVHPIVRQALLADMPPGPRGRWHARAAAVLAAREAEPERVSAQLLRCPPIGEPWAVEALRGAAELALARGVPRAATTYFERALAEPLAAEARAELLTALGLAEAGAGRSDAIEHLSAARALSSDARRRAELAIAIGRLLAVAGDAAEAAELLERAIDELGDRDRELWLRLESELAGVALALPSRAEQRDRLRRLGEQVTGATSAERAVLANLAFDSAITGDSAQRTAGLSEQALAAGSLADELGVDGPALSLALRALVLSGQVDSTDEHLQRALADARARGSVMGIAAASTCQVVACWWRGAIGDLIAGSYRLLELVEELDYRPIVSLTTALLAYGLLERGDVGAAALALAHRDRDGDRPAALSRLASARGRVHLARGDAAAALRELRPYATSGAPGTGPPLGCTRSDAALALLALGERDEARSLAAEELRLARVYGAPRPIGVALRAAGLVENGEAGIELLREAVTLLAPSPARLEHARVLVDLGAALRRHGHRTHAREPLRQGLAGARRCGATALASRAHDELKAAGIREARIVDLGAETLTASERRTAELAAGGMTNRNIAQTLFVTPKTVETHLRHAYRKLDITSRAELADALEPPRGTVGDGAVP